MASRPLKSILILFVCVAAARAQGPKDTRPAEQVFKNIQSLKGIPADQFMTTMGFFSASLGENCTYCHVEESGGSWERYADDNEHKKTARRMISMVAGINKSFFNGRRALTCYSCHRGGEKPETSPDIAQLYGPPRFPEANQFVTAAPNAPAVDQILDQYLQALGGAQKLAARTSFSAKGISQGYAAPKYPMELYAKSPRQRTLVVHGDGDTTTTYDGRDGWMMGPATDMPVTNLDLTTGQLDGAKLDAVLNFPERLKQAYTQWRVGPIATIDDRDMRLVQATSDGRTPINFYFDPETGLLTRTVRYTDSPVGLSPTQVDYADYRDVAGAKMPFKITTSWLDGRSTLTLSDVQANQPVDAARFTRPAARK